MTPQERELMQQALDALNRSDCLGWQFNIPLIKALRAALAQPEQEPTRSQKMRDAGITRRPKGWDKEQECRNDGRCQYAIDHGAEGMGHCPKGQCCMPKAQPEQEPVAWIDWDEEGWAFLTTESCGVPLYRTPPQREWQGLTDKERDEICLGDEAIARAIEQALREKNNG